MENDEAWNHNISEIKGCVLYQTRIWQQTTKMTIQATRSRDLTRHPLQKHD
jgi:hypothetical protein